VVRPAKKGAFLIYPVYWKSSVGKGDTEKLHSLLRLPTGSTRTPIFLSNPKNRRELSIGAGLSHLVLRLLCVILSGIYLGALWVRDTCARGQGLTAMLT
jgi:hypothetical protein